MVEINMCGRAKCCPKAKYDIENGTVTITEGLFSVVLTLTHIENIYKELKKHDI